LSPIAAPENKVAIINDRPPVDNASTAVNSTAIPSKALTPIDAIILIEINKADSLSLSEEKKISAVEAKITEYLLKTSETTYEGHWDGIFYTAKKDENGKIIITRIKNSKLAKVRAVASIPITLPELKKLDEMQIQRLSVGDLNRILKEPSK
jgi:hypothetical protein